MKHLISTFSIFILLIGSVYSQNEELDFEARVFSYGKPHKGATVEVYQAGELVAEGQTKGSGKFNMVLEPELQYMVEVSAEEFALKVIWINTKGTKELDFKVPKFGFDVNLKKFKPGPEEELSKIPVALIKYQEKDKQFYLDKDYKNTVKNKKRRDKETGLQRR